MIRSTVAAGSRRLLLRRLRSDDSGATLIIALVFITVVSVVVAAVLSFADVSFRNTVAVRSQAGQAAAADGAAQLAINNLRLGTYRGTSGNCFNGSATLNLNGFYAQASTTYSAKIACQLDTTDSMSSGSVAINGNNKPANAILTLGTNPAEDGLNLSASGGRTVQVHGSIYSNSNISAGKVSTNAQVHARGACTGTITSTPARLCNLGGVADLAFADPGYNRPAAPTTARTVPSCRGTRVVTFQPGLYTDLAGLNNLTNGCNATFWFQPGTYYFNLGGQWRLRSGYVVGGTPAPGQVANGVTPTMPGSCEPPVPPDPVPAGGWINPGPGAGVRFVLGGSTQIAVNRGRMELCGSYSTSSPPITIYGLKDDIGSGPLQVPRQNGCVVQIGALGCPVLTSDGAASSLLFIQGTTYLPWAAVNIQLSNRSGQVFRDGIIARSLTLAATPNAIIAGPVIEVPDDALPGDLRTVVYLQIYIWPTGTAPPSQPSLAVKVGINDPSGTPVAGQREVTVYSWSVQR